MKAFAKKKGWKDWDIATHWIKYIAKIENWEKCVIGTTAPPPFMGLIGWNAKRPDEKNIVAHICDWTSKSFHWDS